MFSTFIAIIVVMSRGDTLPIGSRTDSEDSEEIFIDYSILSGCELNIQKKCIEIYGTEKNLVGTKNDTCEISKLINCFNIEKQKKECTVEDPGTVYHIDAYIKNVDVTICMTKSGYNEVREIFASPSVGNESEYGIVHRTYSGDRDSYNDDLENGEDDEVSGESGSGHNNHVS